MTQKSNYWLRHMNSSRLSRRRFVGGSAAVGAGAAGLALVGCGDDDDDENGNGNGASPTAGGATPGASPTGAAGDPQSGGTLVLAHPYPEGALTLDPHTQESDGSQRSIRPIYNNLIKYIERTVPGEWELVGDLASSWERPDELTATFTLNQGVLFQNLAPVDGRELTAEDIVYSFERMVTDDPRFVMRSTFQTIESIEAVDDYTVRVTTPFVFAPLLHNMAYPWASIIAREVVENGDIENSPVGTGPFQLDEYARGATLRYSRHPEYFKDGLPYFDSLETPIMPDRGSRLASFRSGELAMEPILATQEQDLLGSNPDVVIHKNPSVSGAVIRFNCEDEYFQNEQVRQAIAAATNVQDYMDIINSGEAIRHGPMPQALTRWQLPDSELPQFDLQRARDLLSAAGYEDGFTVRSTATQPYLSTEQTEITVAHLREIGIEVEIDIVDNATWIDQSYRATNFSFSTYSDYAYSDPDRALRDHYHSEGGNNNHNFSDPDLDVLLDEQRGILDEDERTEVAMEAQRMLLEKAPRVWLHTGIGFAAVQPWLKNYWPRVAEAGANYQDYEQYWRDQS